ALDACLRFFSPALAPLGTLCPTEPAEKSFFSPDGRLVARTPFPTTRQLRVLDAATGRELAVFELAGVDATVAFSSDGKRFAWGNERDARVVRIDRWTEEAHLRTGFVWPEVAFDAAANHLFIVSGDEFAVHDLRVTSARGTVTLEERKLGEYPNFGTR